MCLLIFAHRVNDAYPLVVAANRDEFHARPTAASQFWEDHPQLLAGRDLELGGTWMGVTRSGRFAAVTNYRDPSGAPPAPRSRGELPLDFLNGAQAPQDYLGEVARSAADYAGFNLLVGDTDELWCFHNGRDERPQRLAPGIYGLSNARLDTPWPKVEMGKRRLAQLLQAGALNHDSLAAVVSDRQLAHPAALDLGTAENSMEHLLSAQFIVSEGYGTRSTTTLWMQAGGDTHWREQSFDAGGDLQGQCEECFQCGEQ